MRPAFARFGTVGDRAARGREGTVGIADVHLAELVRNLVLDLGETGGEAQDGVPDILQQRIAQSRQLGQPTRILQDEIADG